MLLAPQPALKRASSLDAVADIELDVSKPSKDVAPVLEDTESAMKAVDESRKKLRATLESLAATRKNLARATDGTTEVVAKFESMQEQLKASLARLASRLADRGQAAEVPPERAARARALGARLDDAVSRATPERLPALVARALDAFDGATPPVCATAPPDSGGGGAARAALEQSSPLRELDEAEQLALVAAALASTAGDRAVGAVVGMAVADAVGAPLEFLPATDAPDARHRWERAANTLVGGCHRFGLAPGQWTDDTAMGLCVADALLAARGARVDGADMRCRFHAWWFQGLNNAFRLDGRRAGSVGLGGNVAASLAALAPGGASPPPAYEPDDGAGRDDAGNGSLMRLAPVAVCFHADAAAAAAAAREHSRTTHPGALAAEACAFLAHAIARAIHAAPASFPRAREKAGARAARRAPARHGGGARCPDSPAAATPRLTTAREILDAAAAEFERDALRGRDDAAARAMRRLLAAAEPAGSAERCWNWRGEALEIRATLATRARAGGYNGYPVSEEYFGAFSLDGLAVALHSVYHSASFGDAVERAVNHLGDADSVGSIAGQLAGAIYGFGDIDRRLKEQLWCWDDGEVATRGAMLYGARALLKDP